MVIWNENGRVRGHVTGNESNEHYFIQQMITNWVVSNFNYKQTVNGFLRFLDGKATKNAGAGISTLRDDVF
mgnify:CR=1 FL=1